MARGVPQETREYAQSIFRELLATRSQRELARELEINQSRVSSALNTGRLAPQTLLAAAKLAGRPDEEVRQHLRRTVGVAVKRERRKPAERAAVLTLAGVEEMAAHASARWAPSADARDVLVAVFAAKTWGYAAEDRKTVLRALDLVSRMHATMELAEEVSRLRWTLDTLRRHVEPTAPGDAVADVEDVDDSEIVIVGE